MCKSDRELLELAAKAAEVELKWTDSGKHYTGGGTFNPLTDDGDALRLAVKLRIDIEQFRNHSTAFHLTGWCDELHVIDAGTATRRAIVRAAAAIGETLP